MRFPCPRNYEESSHAAPLLLELLASASIWTFRGVADAYGSLSQSLHNISTAITTYDY